MEKVPGPSGESLAVVRVLPKTHGFMAVEARTQENSLDRCGGCEVIRKEAWRNASMSRQETELFPKKAS